MDWYLLRGDKVHGPYSSAQLIAAAKSGKLQNQDRFSRTNNGPWSTASSINNISEFLSVEEMPDTPIAIPIDTSLTSEQPKQQKARSRTQLSLPLVATIAGLWITSLLLVSLITYLYSKNTFKASVEEFQSRVAEPNTLASRSPTRPSIKSLTAKQLTLYISEHLLPGQPNGVDSQFEVVREYIFKDNYTGARIVMDQWKVWEDATGECQIAMIVLYEKIGGVFPRQPSPPDE